MKETSTLHHTGNPPNETRQSSELRRSLNIKVEYVRDDR